ncbi:MAG: MFS transporter [Coriobacteriia bacterium]|nr:MFS transporter [Coriobacteriia bacterium]
MTSTENSKYSYLLMLGHLSSDINQGALLACMPFLVLHAGFSYTDVAILVFASNVISAIVQPVFGRLGDVRSCPWVMSLGIFLAGLGMAGVGLLHSYPLIVASAMVSGIGVAMFHPEGGRLANLCAGKQKGNGMSIFAVGGNLGFMIGPAMTAAALSAWGMAGTAVFLIHSTLCALLLLRFGAKFRSFGLRDAASVKLAGRDRWDLFGAVMAVLSFRSVLFNTLLTFVPLLLVSAFGQTEAFGSLVITLYSIFGAVATFFSGRISARTGAQRLLLVCMVGLTCILVGFVLCDSLVVTCLLVGCSAVLLNALYPSTVALAQGFVPGHLGTASGLTYGVAVAVGGMLSPVMGSIGDAYGLTCVFMVAAGFALVGSILALVLRLITGNTHMGR